MIRADKLGMSDGDYQFIYVKITMPSTNDIHRLESTGLWENGDLDDDDARRGFENLLYVSITSVLNFNFFMFFLSRAGPLPLASVKIEELYYNL